MKLLRIIIHTCLYLPYGFHKITGTGAFGSQGAEYLSGPIQADGNALKKALLKHHVKQYHEASCSVASVVTAINAVRTGDNDRPVPITQANILEKVKTGNWKKRMSEGGDNGRRGLPLALLGEIVKSSFDAYGITYTGIETVHTPKNSSQSGRIRETLLQRLHAFEEKGNCLIIAHFNQGAYVRTLSIPHISPVGGFDPKTRQVTILDVDPSQEGLYKISFDTFYKGMSSDYHHFFRPFGYKSGGYIFITLSFE